jgi:predicted metal-dependent HD superfamily phosphohydrolase
MDELLEEIENYIRALFQEHCNESFFFHNLSHTQKVASRVIEIAREMNLGAADTFKVTAAAWFHDTGYLFAHPLVHEEKSAEVMREFMAGKADDSTLAEIAACIMATKYPTNPESLLQQILCDADTYHFGTNEFAASNKKVFLEFRMKVPGLGQEAFNQDTIFMLIRHQFYTPYCDALLMAGKQRNLDRLLLNYY